MSDILSIGASGVRAYQLALSTVADNIANASTAGYSRRSTNLERIAASSSRIGQRQITDGLGVAATGIKRQADDFRSTAVRAAGADLARTQTSAVWLDQIETSLGGQQLGTRIASFFNSAKAVSADPAAITPRVAMLEAGAGVAIAFTATGRALDQITADLDIKALAAVDELNTLGYALARVNQGLDRASPGTGNRASLLDQRDTILEKLSALSDVNVAIDANGRAAVRLGGATGPMFVGGAETAFVTYQRSGSAVAYIVEQNGTVASLSPVGGALAGLAEGAQRIGDARVELNRIATGLVDGVNTLQSQGRDLDGNPGAAIFAVGATPSDISVSLINPRGIAAAAVGGGPRNNSNLIALETLRTTGQFEADTASFIATNAATLASRRTVAAAQAAIHDGAIVARDQVTGVNLDSEAVDLIRFQQAYQASSRIIQVARETLQTLLDIR